MYFLLMTSFSKLVREELIIMKHKYLFEYTEVMEEWDYNKNNLLSLNPEDISYGSGIRTHWICKKCGNEWRAIVRNRIRGQGCPICSAKKISIKKSVPKNNKLSLTHPELVNEWDYDKNVDIDFYNISTFSNKKVWWKCLKGHEYQDIISNRTKRNNGCPYCSNHQILKGYNDISTIAPHLAKEWNYDKNIGIDIYKVGAYSNKKVWWKCKNGHEWEVAPNNRMRATGCPKCLSKKKISFPEKTIAFYLKQLFIVEEQKKFVWLGKMEIDIYLPSLNLAIEYDGQVWHQNLEKDLIKENLLNQNGVNLIRIREPNCPSYTGNCKCIITDETNKNFFVKKALDELLIFINNKYSLKYQFKYDYENDYLQILEAVATERGDNNLCLLFPKIAKQWNYAKNNNLKPSMFAPASNVIVWWKCKNEHEWSASISDRTIGGRGCPYCSNQKLLKGFNDLETRFPYIAQEWDYEKNKNLKPCDITYGTNRIVYWKCVKGHSWEASVVSRTKVGNNCPICSNRKVLRGYNDLESQFPELVKEWDFSKNLIKPYEISYHYDNKVYWICKKGHSYEASVYSRVKKKTSCPVCANQKILSGYNDLLSKNPQMASEWDYEKNTILPNQIAEQSNIKYWWKCKNNHSYEASPSNRFKGKGCPYCSNRKVLKGYNDLQTLYPDKSIEWDYEKNGDLKPTDVTAHSSKKVFWKCRYGHCWKTSIRDRTSGGTNCPHCYQIARKKILK